MRTRGTTVGVLVAVVSLASCTAGEVSRDSVSAESYRQESYTSAKVPEATAEETPPPARPAARACYVLGFDEATEPTNDSPPVACKQRHTAQTYYVGRLDTVVDGHLLAVDSRRAQRQLERTCPRKLDEYVGGTAQDRALSRIEAVWFSPTLEESDRGASWFRCDAVALARPSDLAPLPPPRELRGILDRADALDEVGLCGTEAPGADGFERVICARRHAWRAISTIDISAGPDYPGVEAVREAGESTCRDQVQAASGSPEKFTYGWEWPTSRQWREGQRFGYCWAPD